MIIASQKLFEDTYLENKEIFEEMSHEEIVAETVNQLTSQGVNLKNILCSAEDFSVDEDNIFVYKVLAASDNFFEDLSSENAQSLISLMKKDLATRVFAAKHGTYSKLIDQLKTNNYLLYEVLIAMLEKQPDLVSKADMELIMEIFGTTIGENESKDVIMKYFLQLVINICTLHEENRQAMVAVQAPELIVKVLISCPKLFVLSCSALRVFLLDDDVRVPFGKAHEHAQHIVGHLEGISKVIEGYKLSGKDLNCNIALFSTLSKFCVRNEYCQQCVDFGAFEIATELLNLEDMRGNEKFVISVLSFLKTAGGNDDVKDKIAEVGFLKSIMGILDEFSHSEQVCHAALVTLSVVVLRKPQYSKQVFDFKFAQIVVLLLDRYSESIKVQNAAFLAIRTLVNRSEEGKQMLIANGVEEYLQKASEIDELKQNANDTLRVIESSKGTLSEPWTGQQGDRIAHD